MPSFNLQRYLAARASGASVEEACATSGIGMGEAELHEADIASGELELPKINQGESDMAREDRTDDEQTIELTADHLRGDVRDAILGWFKAAPKPWAQLGEAEQRDFADAADRFARSLIKQACRHIAAVERPCIVAQLVEYREKDGVEAKLKLPSTGECVTALHEACGREVLIVCSGEEEFQGEEAPAEVTKDQPELGIGAEYEEAA
jgi:hypothetical protein